MERMFAECQSEGQEQKEELDTYLKLHRQMNAGNTFHQMMQSRKFASGSAQGGQGKGEDGQGGAGYVISSRPAMDVLGGETMLSSGNAQNPSTSQIGSGQGKENPRETPVQLEKSGPLNGMKPVNRKSDAVSSEAPIDSYDDVVNQYFKAISK
jgi:hypothetical protein